MGVFETILQQGISKGHIPARTQKAREWYREASRDYGSRIRGGDGKEAGRIDYGRINETAFLKQNQSQLVTRIMPGSMYMYHYDPKMKDELPYYDRFPLIFPFKVESDRFWGINLHYLPLPYRAKLMDALYDLATNKRYDETTRLQLSYKLLNGVAKFRYFKPCIKQYLTSHVESRFLYIHPDQWDIALFLPLERFEKKSKAQVWAESKKQIGTK